MQTCTVYVQIFEGRNFWGFHGQLAIRKIFIHKANLWVASVGEQWMARNCWLNCDVEWNIVKQKILAGENIGKFSYLV